MYSGNFDIEGNFPYFKGGAKFYSEVYTNISVKRDRSKLCGFFSDYYYLKEGTGGKTPGELLKDWLIENNVLISHKKLVRESDPQKAEDISYDINSFWYEGKNNATLSEGYTKHVLGDTVYDYTEVNKYLYCANYRPNERSAYCLLNNEIQSTEKVKGDFLEFGVARGRTMIYSIYHNKEFSSESGTKFFGFDSFQSFPKPKGVDLIFERFIYIAIIDIFL